MKHKKIIILEIIILAILIFTILLAWKFSSFGKIFRVSKPEVFEIITDKPRDPQIIEVTVDPLNVQFGKTQILTVKIKTKATAVTQEDSVLGTAITDNKTTDFPLKLKKAEGKEELITTWQGEWKREDSVEKNYQIRILAKNEKGQDQATLTFK